MARRARCIAFTGFASASRQIVGKPTPTPSGQKRVDIWRPAGRSDRPLLRRLLLILAEGRGSRLAGEGGGSNTSMSPDTPYSPASRLLWRWARIENQDDTSG